MNIAELDKAIDRHLNIVTDLLFSRCAAVVWLLFIAGLTAGAPFWKAAVVSIVALYLYRMGFGRRWLERLAFGAITCASIYFIDVVPVDAVATRGRQILAAAGWGIL